MQRPLCAALHGGERAQQDCRAAAAFHEGKPQRAEAAKGDLFRAGRGRFLRRVRGERNPQPRPIRLEGTDAGQIQQNITGQFRAVELMFVDDRILPGVEPAAHRPEVLGHALLGDDGDQRAGGEHGVTLAGAAALDRDHVTEQIIVEIAVGTALGVCLLLGTAALTGDGGTLLSCRHRVAHPPPERLGGHIGMDVTSYPEFLHDPDVVVAAAVVRRPGIHVQGHLSDQKRHQLSPPSSFSLLSAAIGSPLSLISRAAVAPSAGRHPRRSSSSSTAMSSSRW